MKVQLRTYQQEAVDSVIGHIRSSVSSCMIILPTGCHAKGTKVIMFDGSIKNVEDVAVGDRLMGPDSKPRNVLALCRGREEMRKITPVKGDSFVVNKNHILHLKKVKQGNKYPSQEVAYINETVDEYENSAKWHKHIHKLCRTGVSFPEAKQSLPARFIGMILGDGSTANGSVTFSGTEDVLINYFKNVSESFGCCVNDSFKNGTNTHNLMATNGRGKHESNAILNEVKKLGLQYTNSYTVFIPECYKIASKEQRIELLSGLIDTDGYLGNNYYEITTVSCRLADDIAFVARSLGLAAYIGVGDATLDGVFVSKKYRVTISGDIDMLKPLIDYKVAHERKQIKDVLCTGFKVEELPEDDFYGFTLDDDHLYLTSDFTIHHNSGKSVVVASIADWVFKNTGKRVLCVAPTSELVVQNRQRYLSLTGEPASMFSAKAGPKNLRHPVVFGSPVTIKNSIEMFGDKYGAVIIDECDGITPTIKFIINEMKRRNPKLRVIGMTATPYRLGTGYIYKDHYLDGPTDEETAIDPYYDKVVYELEAKFLIENGYLTPPVTEPVFDEYDTSCLEKDKLGRYTTASVEKAMVGKGRKTSRIVEDIIRRSVNRRGTMIFASTKKHAMEIMESLPPGSYSYVFGDMPTADRNKAISDFKAQKVKYIVNQNILTVGVDVPHCDHIAVMRATESPRLYQQIIGRGTRLYEGKEDFLVSDYAGNIQRHFSETGDLFTPEIKATRKKPSVPMDVKCPLCGFINEFGVRPNPENLEVDKEGYWLDLAGDRVMIDIFDKSGEKIGSKPMPAHFGRRCKNYVMHGPLREMHRCTYKWSVKECPDCGFENDIAARNCTSCGAEIIDPNQKLKEEADRLDSSPYATKQSNVTMMNIMKHYVSSGEDLVHVKFAIEQKPFFVSKFYNPNSEKEWMKKEWEEFCGKCFGESDMSIDDAIAKRDEAVAPSVIMFRRDKGSKYFNVKGMYWGVL